jgi:hypothetical protein
MDFEEIMNVPTAASEEEKANDVWDDDNCCNYTADGQKLIEGYNFPERVKVRPGTRIICDEAFAFQDYMDEDRKAGEEIPLDERVSFLEHIEMPDTLTHIGNQAFRECGWMKSIRLPKGLKSIGDLAFAGCWSLGQVSMPASLLCLGEESFGECFSLRKVRLDKGLKIIGSGAFYYCESLEEVNIPSGLEILGQDVFEGCKKLKRIIMKKEMKPQIEPLLPKKLRSKIAVI